MAGSMYYELPEFSAILSFIDAIFADLNMGLFIYYLEDPDDPKTLRLVYANNEASRSTGANLNHMIGKSILEAFPNLADTGLPEAFAEVLAKREPKRWENFEYSYKQLQKKTYDVKAFPMPSNCMGVLFESV